MAIWKRILVELGQKPTLPFLLGAIRKFDSTFTSSGDDLEDVLSLLKEMAATPISKQGVDYFVLVQRCNEIKVPVFSICHSDYLVYPASFPSSRPGIRRLCFSSGLEPTPEISIEEVADNLLAGFGHADAIASERYSRRNDEWFPFDAADKNRIRIALVGQTT